MASMFWFLWQQCYEDDQDDEIKNATYCEQVFAWVLGVGLLLCCICMIVFVSLLLVGNSLISNGTIGSTDAAVSAIPLVCVCLCVYKRLPVYVCKTVCVRACVCVLCVCVCVLYVCM